MKKLIFLITLLIIPNLVYSAPPTRTYNYVSGDTIDPAKVTTNEDNIFNYLQSGVDTFATGGIGSSEIATGGVASSNILDGTIANIDISSSASIADSKLATISTAGKVSGAAITSISSLPASAGYIPDANLAVTGVTAGSYTNTSLTVDAQGRITSASNGSSSGMQYSDTRTKIVTFDRDVSVSGTQTISGVGFTPTSIEFWGTVPSSTTRWASMGVYDGTTNSCVYEESTGWNTHSTRCIYFVSVVTPAGNTTAYVSSVNSDGCVLTWAVTSGSPTGTANIIAIFRR